MIRVRPVATVSLWVLVVGLSGSALRLVYAALQHGPDPQWGTVVLALVLFGVAVLLGLAVLRLERRDDKDTRDPTDTRDTRDTNDPPSDHRTN